jgi:hypothetical protein
MFINYFQKQNQTQTPVLPRMGFVMNSRRPVVTVSPSPPVKETTETINPSANVIMWAQPTWIVLHTLAEKVSEEHFASIRVGLLNIIYTIVSLLPCPICSQHGKTYLDGINFNTIVSKENLKYMLFDFHNLVNDKKKYPIFLYSELVKYENVNTINAIQNFMVQFSKKSGSIRLLSEDLHRKRMTLELKKWFNENIKKFTP